MSEAPLPSDQRVWTRYADKQPEQAGPYRWRIPSKAVPGVIVEFVAHMRERGAGYKTALSPSFDYWDGYQLHVPPGTEWTTTEVVCKPHEKVGLVLPQIELLPCPFCRIVPFWKGVELAHGGGVFVGSAPHQYNSFWLECCGWAKTPHRDDPRELARQRNTAIRGATP